MIELTDENFQTEVIESSDVVLVDFWATWCAPCRAMVPILEKLATQYAGQLKVGKLDIDTNEQVRVQYGIMSIPTLMFFKDGEPVKALVGAVPPSKVEIAIKEVLGG